MLSFKNFMNEEEMPQEPVPQGADANMWNDPDGGKRYRYFWKMANKQQAAPNLAQTNVTSPAQQQKPMQRTGHAIGSLPGRYDNNVANSISIAMSPAGRATYKYYWSEKEQKVKPNPYHPDNAIR